MTLNKRLKTILLALLLVSLGIALGALLTMDYWSVHYARLLQQYQVETLSQCDWRNYNITIEN